MSIGTSRVTSGPRADNIRLGVTVEIFQVNWFCPCIRTWLGQVINTSFVEAAGSVVEEQRKMLSVMGNDNVNGPVPVHISTIE